MPEKPTYEELEQKVKDFGQEVVRHKQTEEKQRESLERFQAILDTALDSIFCKNINRQYTLVNPSTVQLLNSSEADLLGKTSEEIFDKEAAAIIKEADQRTLNGENINEIRTLIIAGKPTTFHIIQSPLRDSDDNINGISGIVRDITDPQAIEMFAENE